MRFSFGLLILVLAACFQPDPLDRRPCDQAADCPQQGARCELGLCQGGVSAADGGVPADGGPAMDGGPATDSGPADAGCDGPDPIDDEGVDSNCDGVDGVAEDTIYIDNVGGSPLGDGSLAAPVPSLELALVRLANTGGATSLVVASGTYTVADGVELPAGLSLYGGFTATDGLWERNLFARANLEVSAAGLRVGGGSGVRVEFLNLVGASTDGGRAALGLVLVDGEGLTVRNLEITAGQGGDAVDHGDHPPPEAAFGDGGEPGTDCSRVEDCHADFGNQGINPLGGHGGIGCDEGLTSGSAGGFGGSHRDQGIQMGGCPGERQQGERPRGCLRTGLGENGEDGAVGSDGAAGSNGGPGNGLGSFRNAYYYPGGAQDGSAGDSGTGGMGGAGGGATLNSHYGGGGGGGGGGGCGGSPGRGGDSGGSSIALVVLRGSPTLESVRLVASGGGAGGAGYAGAVGGVGGDGGGGGGALDGLGTGGNGGGGGTGGDGGSGGGGGGGPSVGIWLVEPLVSSLEASDLSIQTGAGGQGGASPAHAGAAGRVLEIYRQPPENCSPVFDGPGTETFGFVCSEAMDWESAWVVCQAAGAQLMRIDGSDRNGWVQERAGDLGLGERLWLGLNARERQDDWRWADGSVPVYTNWRLPPGDGDCVSLNVIDEPIGLWVAGPCAASLPFACSW